MMYDRTYGVEMECLSPVPHASVVAALRAVGVNCSTGQRLGSAPHWVVTYDGSVGGPGTSTEVKSPPLSGEAGIEEVRKVCVVLTRLGCAVNRTCGLHVHVDVRQVPLQAMKKLVISYADDEPVVDVLMPRSRRGNANNYCRSIAGVDRGAVAAAGTLQSLARVANPTRSGGRGGRFVKLNLHAFWRHGTVEFRQHSGTIDPVKVPRAIGLWLKFVDAAVDDPSLPEGVRRRRRPLRGRKLQYIQMITRPEGATRDEVHAATGWHGNIGLHAMAREAGLMLSSTREEGRGLVHRGVPAAQPEATARPSFQTLASKLKMDADEVQYWTERMAALGGSNEVHD